MIFGRAIDIDLTCDPNNSALVGSILLSAGD